MAAVVRAAGGGRGRGAAGAVTEQQGRAGVTAVIEVITVGQ